MNIVVCESKEAMGRRAAADGAELIRGAIAERGEANIVLATGVSQFEMLEALVQEDIAWPRIEAFHLDEYVGLSIEHPASFRRYLKERFADRVPVKEFHYIDAENDPVAECERLNGLIGGRTIDVAFIGIGENGHLAFNDPPADFETEEPYIVVELDEACRRQQVGEGWFETMDDVPREAISMSVPQIMKSRAIVCSVPEERKAEAMEGAVLGPVTPDLPASALQEHEAATLYLDTNSASRLPDTAADETP
jgi:glucosamine-6-phosphate deaminase